MKKTIPGFLLAGVMALATACNDSASPGGTPPPLPPSSSMISDFSTFQGAPTSAAASGHAAGAMIGATWVYSAINVTVWNTILGVTLVAPVAAFQAASAQTPVVENGVWTWRYTFNVIGAQYSARLEGRPANGSVDWDMYISKTGAYTDFHWYEGSSKADSSSGTWSLKLSPDQPVNFLDIAWNRNASTNTGDIKYTNVLSTSPDNGKYLFYARTTSTSYNAHVELGKNSSVTTRIEWSTSTKAGRVRDEAHFGDANWHCWDTALNNVAC